MYDLVISSTISLIIITVGASFIHAQNKKIKHLFDLVSAEEVFDDRFLTSYEKSVYQRNKEFDERIERFQDDVFNTRKGTVAEEFHPDVHNIPHNAVRISDNSLPDVEISD